MHEELVNHVREIAGMKDVGIDVPYISAYELYKKGKLSDAMVATEEIHDKGKNLEQNAPKFLAITMMTKAGRL